MCNCIRKDLGFGRFRGLFRKSLGIGQFFSPSLNFSVQRHGEKLYIYTLSRTQNHVADRVDESS